MTVKKVEFFDLTTDELDSVVNLDKHVFYKDVYAFVNRLKNCSFFRKKEKIRHVIFQCLRETALI